MAGVEEAEGGENCFLSCSSNPYPHFRGVNSTYAAASVLCEFLYGLNIFVQWWMVDTFLGRYSPFLDLTSLFVPLLHQLSIQGTNWPLGRRGGDSPFSIIDFSISRINFQTLLQVDPKTTVNFLNLGIQTMTSDRPLLALNILFPKQVTGFSKTGDWIFQNR